MDTNTRTAPSMKVLAGLSGACVVVLAVVAGVGAVDYYTYTGSDPLIGLSMLMAYAAAGTALLGGSLAGAGWLLRRRRPSLALGLAIAGTTVLLLPVAGSAMSVLLLPFL